MFHADEIATENLDHLTDQINIWLGDALAAGLLDNDMPANSVVPLNALDDVSDLLVDSDYQLGESFIVYRVDADTIQSPNSLGQDLIQLARLTGRRHLQLKVNQRPVAYARSNISKNDAVCQLLVSDLAQALDDAVVWIDAYEKTHPEYAETQPLVRLLTVPAYNVNAFWIFKGTQSESDVLVVSAPEWLKKLERERLLNTTEFLQAFAGELPITGLG